MSVIQDKHEFQPMVATYAIVSGELKTPQIAEFEYILFAVENGFDEALAQAAPPIKRLVDRGDGIQPAAPVVTRLVDIKGNTQRIELRHPDYAPFGAGIPLMFIQLINIDEPTPETVKIMHVLPKKEDANGGLGSESGRTTSE